MSDVTERVCTVTQGLLGCALYTVATATKTVKKVVDLGLETASSLELIGCRNLCAKSPKKGRWDIDIKLAAAANLEYVLAASFTGAASLPLGDSRCIALTPDLLTLLCIQGGLPGILSGTHGWLDGEGCATARLDLDLVQGLIGSGVKVWVSAVVLDAKASLGIKTICDPIVICL